MMQMLPVLKKFIWRWDLRISGVGLMVDICTNAIVNAFQRFRAPFAGKIVHIFPEQSAAFN